MRPRFGRHYPEVQQDEEVQTENEYWIKIDRQMRQWDRPRVGSVLALALHFNEFHMNQDQVNGKLKDIGGKIQEETAKIVGNPTQQVKGLEKQVEGKTQEKLGDLKQAVKDATK